MSLQESSDMSLLDVDIASAYSFVLSSGSDLIGMIFIISLVTWKVLLVFILVLFITRWIQVRFPSAYVHLAFESYIYVNTLSFCLSI